MESLGPVVSNGQLEDSLNPQNHNLKAPVHTLEPDTSAAEKAVVTGKGHEKLDSLAKIEKPEQGWYLFSFLFQALSHNPQPPLSET
jgi:hypothetical protein